MKFIKACANQFRPLGDLAEILAMNKHAPPPISTQWLKVGNSVRAPAPPAKSAVKMQARWHIRPLARTILPPVFALPAAIKNPTPKA